MIGHNMYSSSFNRFYEFVQEDVGFFQTRIHELDMVAPVPVQTTVAGGTRYQRNQIFVSQVLESADYRCEHDAKHVTFTSAATLRPYMEGHHLIPMSRQSEFGTSLDVYANIVCLCPTCHRLMHHATAKEKKYAMEALFEKRSERLVKSGIDISKKEFLKLVV